jgi:hypothetical protein
MAFVGSDRTARITISSSSGVQVRPLDDARAGIGVVVVTDANAEASGKAAFMAFTSMGGGEEIMMLCRTKNHCALNAHSYKAYKY